jgi:hypothetical protein
MRKTTPKQKNYTLTLRMSGNNATLLNKIMKITNCKTYSSVIYDALERYESNVM